MTNMIDQPTPPKPPPSEPPSGQPSAGDVPPTAGPTPRRLLRRSSTDRVASGVCGGLGAYFGVDPVLFRVLFATTAFLGIGIVGYLIAWAAMPEQGTPTSAADRFAGELRRRRVPLWLVVIAAGAIGWAVLSSFLSPWPFFPVAAAAIVLIIALNRRSSSPPRLAGSAYYAAPAQQTVPYQVSDAPPADYRPVGSELGDWVRESAASWRERRARNRPMRIAAWGVLGAALGTLAIADAVSDIRIPVYFWTTTAIVVGSLIVGAVIRRPVWGLAVLVIPSILGGLAFGGTRVSFHDGSGDRLYTPRSAADLHAQYRMAFGRSTFDLRELPPGDGRTVRIQQAAGEVKIIVPRSADVRVHAALRAGAITLDGAEVHSGFNFDRDVVLGSAGREQLTLDVRVEEGAVTIGYAP
ncbi:MAG: PspC domain-containing protein [Actinomycetota bacterium]